MTDDIERDLATVLTARAGHAHTDAHHAMAEHERRMRARGQAMRTRAVAGAAAAVAVVALGAALALNPFSTPRPLMAAAPPTRSAPMTRPAADPTFKLADFTAQGKRWTAYVMIDKLTPPDETVPVDCVEIVGVPAGQIATTNTANWYPVSVGCHAIMHSPSDPLFGAFGVLNADDTDPGPLPNLLVVVTEPAVSDISIVDPGGDTSHASLLATTANVKIFVTSKHLELAKQVTYRDDRGTVLRQTGR
jgi:hypothetical protein